MVEIDSIRTFSDRLKFVLDDDQNSNPHLHDRIELIYLLSGEATVRTSGREYRLAAEDFLVIEPYELHSIMFAEPSGHALSFYIADAVLSLLDGPTRRMRL